MIKKLKNESFARFDLISVCTSVEIGIEELYMVKCFFIYEFPLTKLFSGLNLKIIEKLSRLLASSRSHSTTSN
jgi:hypothetical protein